MFELIKNKTAELIISGKLKHQNNPELSFSSALQKSFSFLLLMPADDKDYREAFNVLDYLENQGKTLTILTNDFRVSLLPAKYRNKAIGFAVTEINKLDLPTHKLTERLREKLFDVVIDLNREENLFYSYIANIVKSKIRIGFKKRKADVYYNFLVDGSDNDSAKSYNNFLNCIKMF
ncbi:MULTISPECIES: hypothetical protein [Ignavibacterium]|jgi:hypothetical protein|uniref:hypothetical protein n=1 Tax=Ignavibacterium TaxID=795750 RepID=UPI0025C0BC7B|nr:MULTISPECIES: hypothetical protein [Ignavibacterium]MBI5661842.1 hypothetical protein [Ignavibacterium album]